MERWNIRIAICIAILVVTFVIAGLMFQIDRMYKTDKYEHEIDIEFRKRFYSDTKTLECFQIFKETGFVPKYCKDIL
jgi:hypothetical protein